MAHSKRNTSRSIFTSYEREIAKTAWSASSARLSRESFLPFASCCLCLEPAIDPVACSRGDIFCRECALSNILAQKKEIKRLEKARGQEEREALEEQARQDAEAQQRAIREFELTQAGFDVKVSDNHARNAKAEKATEIKGIDKQNSPEVKRGEKRSFSLDEDEVARIAIEDRAKARRRIDEEKGSKETLPSFWVPSVMPSSIQNDALHRTTKKVKTQPICPASPDDKPHYYSLHALVTVNFTEEADSTTKTSHRICPSCKKVLSNTSKATLAKPCGHVLCKNCVNRFMSPSGERDPHSPESDPNAVRCYVCDADLTERPGLVKEKDGKGERGKIQPGLVELRSEGTGFSAGGVNQVKKSGLAFQC